MKLLLLSLARHDDTTTSTTFQLASCFQKSHEVLIVEHPYTWIEIIRNLMKKSGQIRLIATLLNKPMVVQKGGVNVLIPPALMPINFLPKGKIYQLFSRWNQKRFAAAINKNLKQLKWSEYEYINSYNYHFPIVHRFLSGKILSKTYHCVDPIVKPYTKKHGIDNERNAVLNTERVISTAPSLQQKWSTISTSYLVPNAVNFDHFNRPLKKVNEVRAVGRKIVGYFGNIERRMDYSLLENTFRKHPEWDLVLAGPVQEQYLPQSFSMLPNVHFIGSYTYDKLPDLIHSVDATIIPFKCDEASKAIYPLKLYEYLSVGKPVISTLFNPEIFEGLKDVIYLAQDQETLEQATMEALYDFDPFHESKRRYVASQNTWQDRADSFIQLIKRNNHDTPNQKSNKELFGSQSKSQATLLKVAI